MCELSSNPGMTSVLGVTHHPTMTSEEQRLAGSECLRLTSFIFNSCVQKKLGFRANLLCLST